MTIVLFAAMCLWRADAPPLTPAEASRVNALVQAAKSNGDAVAGAKVFVNPKNACVSCHKLGPTGGDVGPALDAVGNCLPPHQIVESLLWPEREIKPQFAAVRLQLDDGSSVQGVKRREAPTELVLWDPSARKEIVIERARIEGRKEGVSSMPGNLAAGMSETDLRDLVRFLIDCRGTGSGAMIAHLHKPATFAFGREPLDPKTSPSWRAPVNRDRLYDFYAKEADHFRTVKPTPLLLPEFPGLDGGALGHWGNQNESVWTDGRWNDTILDRVQAGVFRVGDRLVPRTLCVTLGDGGDYACAFDPDTLTYVAAWRGRFLKFSSVRHGVMAPLESGGEPIARPERPLVAHRGREDFRYLGYYRSGERVWFAFEHDGKRFLDSPWIENGKFVHELRTGAASPAPVRQDAPVIAVRGRLSTPGSYAVETIPMPTANPWKALCFACGHDFLPNGTGVVAMLHGDVWMVDGLDEKLENVRWRRFATGLHQPLGVVCDVTGIYVLGRDRITRLHDRDGDGVADFYESFSDAYQTSPAGHDYICGLERDSEGRFYTASGNQGLVRISADGKRAEVLATGLRNPDGIGLYPDHSVTAPVSEGDWTPASAIMLAKGGEHFGYGGLKDGKTPTPPLVYLPRGIDNSAGGQVYIAGERWGPTQGRMVHLSHGAGTYFLLLRDRGSGAEQGAVWPMPGEFRSGAHRGRFNPVDGQLYVSGCQGWGTYTQDDGSFERVRFRGGPVTLPTSYAAHRNGVRIEFSEPLDPHIAGEPSNHFAQAWNYRFGPGYGSPEFSPSQPGVVGHDAWKISTAALSRDRKSLFLELPDLRPVNQLHLRLIFDAGPPHDLFATINEPRADFVDYPGYKPSNKPQSEHPLVADVRNLKNAAPNPWRRKLPNARPIEIAAGPNLTFEPRVLRAKPGERLALTFVNPDVVPHNWALLKPGKLQSVGDLANKLIADPGAVARHYIPETPDVVAYTSIVYPRERFTIYFSAPAAAGRYPFLCSFPGHWMVMNGELIVEK